MGGACSTGGELRNTYKILVGKHEGKENSYVFGRIILKWVLRK
jgi:hypothetical protein